MSNGVVLHPKTPLYAKACEPLNAIRFSLEAIDDPFDIQLFLKDWNEGVWWPEYVVWLRKR